MIMKIGTLLRISATIAVALLFAACHDDLPPAGPGDNGAGSSQILLTEIIDNDNGRMIAVNADGSNRQVIGNGVVITSPHNGKTAYLVSVNDSTTELYVAQTSGAGPVLVHRFEYHPSIETGERIQGLGTVLSPDGSQIVYISRMLPVADPFTDEGQIYIISASGGTPRPLADRIGHEITPAFSPDGQRIAYYDDSGNLRVVSTSGGTAFVVADSAYAHHDGFSRIEWSPDGSRIAFTRQNESPSGSDICTVAPNGSDLRNLTATADDGMWPTWSPDGKKLVYLSDSDGHLYTINADGSGRQRVATPSDEQIDLYPEWSPDGKKIIYTAYYGDPDKAPGTIRVLDLSSGSIISLSSQGYKGFWLK
jgi:Tol biopolymer transport system component